MSFQGITHFSQRMKRNLFRRDAESSYYSSKEFPLPAVEKIRDSKIELYKSGYPYNFIHSAPETEKIRDIFLEMEDGKDAVLEGEYVIDNIFTFPGREKVNLGNSINWHRDYISGYEWPREIAWKHNYLDFPAGTDIINPWLLGRLNQLIHLGKAYLSGGNEKYTAKYVSLIDEFNQANQFCTGLNWCDPAEVSIRAINLVFSLTFFIHSDLIDSIFLDNFRRTVLRHAVFIESNLQTGEKDYGYLVNLAALAAAGLALRDSYYGEKILRQSYSASEKAVRKMVSNEGVFNVRSLPYHPHLLELFIILGTAFTKASIKPSAVFRERYSRMFDVLASLLRGDGSIPGIGDPFVRRILPLSSASDNFPLAVGCIEFRKGVFKDFIPLPTADVLFYKGIEGVSQYYQLRASAYNRISYGYPRSGIFILRNENMHITVDASEVTYGGKRTSGHNDILSFNLSFKGSRVVTDPGLKSFYSDPAQQKKFHSALNHSTICIDDKEPVEFEENFRIKEDLTKPKITEWHSDETEDMLSVQHYAYTRYPDPVVVKRIFRLQKERNRLIIRDELFGGGTHRALSSIILHPDVIINQTGNMSFNLGGPVDGSITITSPAENIICSIQESVYSPRYGEMMSTKKITLSLAVQFPVYFITEIELR